MISKVKQIAVVVAVAAISHVSVADLVNGDFEATPFDTGWTHGGSVAAGAGLVSGSTVSADLNGTEISQLFDAGLTSGWTFDAVVSLDDTAGGQRFRLRSGSNVDLITFRLTGSGLEEYSGGWSLAVAQAITTGTAYHVRVDVNAANTDIVYSLSTDGSSYTDSAVFAAGHGSLTPGFGTATMSGNMVIDEVTVIPEPATLGLVAAFGGGILFIRRKLMI